MSNYTQTTFFAPKDALSPGNADKIIYGAEIDPELSAIAAAIATKYDSGSLADEATAEALASNTTLITPLRLANVLQDNGGMAYDIQQLAAPAGDRLLFWDNSAGGVVPMTISTGLLVVGTSLSVNETELSHNLLAAYVANEHVDHSTVSITGGTGLSGGGDLTAPSQIDLSIDSLGLFGGAVDASNDMVAMYDASTGNHYRVPVDSINAAGSGFVTESRAISSGTGLTGGGDLSADRTISLSHLGIESLTDPNDDRIMFWDDSAGGTRWLDVGSGLSVSGTVLSVDNSALSITESQISDFGDYLSDGGTITNGRITNLDLGISATDTTITRRVAGQMAVAGDTVFSHSSASYDSAKITYSSGAPSGGTDGDLWFEY